MRVRGLPPDFRRRDQRLSALADLSDTHRRCLMWLPADGAPRTREHDDPAGFTLVGFTGALGGLLAERVGYGSFRLLPLGVAIRSDLVTVAARADRRQRRG